MSRVGRQKEPILGYVPKKIIINTKKNYSDST